MKLAVLDYNCGDVDIIDNVPDMTDNDEIENYLIDRLNYNLDEINWMDLTKGRVNNFTPDDFGN